MGAKTDPSMDAKDKQMAASGRARRAEKIRRDELPEASPEIDDGAFSMMDPSQRDEGASRGFEGAINRSRRGRRGRRGGPRRSGRLPMFIGDSRRGGGRPPFRGGEGRPPMFGGDPRRGDPRRGGGRPPMFGGDPRRGDPRRGESYRRGGGDPRRGGGRPPFTGGSNSQYETNSKFRGLIDGLLKYKGKR